MELEVVTQSGGVVDKSNHSEADAFSAVGRPEGSAMGLSCMYIEQCRRDEKPNARGIVAALAATIEGKLKEVGVFGLQQIQCGKAIFGLFDSVSVDSNNLFVLSVFPTDEKSKSDNDLIVTAHGVVVKIK